MKLSKCFLKSIANNKEKNNRKPYSKNEFASIFNIVKKLNKAFCMTF